MKISPLATSASDSVRVAVGKGGGVWVRVALAVGVAVFVAVRVEVGMAVGGSVAEDGGVGLGCKPNKDSLPASNCGVKTQTAKKRLTSSAPIPKP